MALLKYFSIIAGISVVTAPLSAKVVINEISYDDQGGDTSQYIELYNDSNTAVNLGDWQFTMGKDTGVEGVVVFNASHSIPAKGYFIIGAGGTGSNNIGVTPDAVLFGTETQFRNLRAFATLKDSSGAIADSVVWARGQHDKFVEEGNGEPATDGTPLNGGGIWSYLLTSKYRNINGGTLALGVPAEPNHTLTLQRNPDSVYLDSNDNDLDFYLAVATPKEKNFSRGTVTPTDIINGLTFDFNGTVNTQEKKLAGNNADMNTQDPAAATVPPTNTYTPTNTSVIPSAPAPGGGNVGLFYSSHTTPADLSAGSSVILNVTEAIKNVEAETLVYMGSPLTGAQWEAGSYLILRGRPDPQVFQGENPTAPTCVNGDVGVRIRFENNIGGSGKRYLYVEQQKYGVSSQYGNRVEIPSAGWYRLLLSVNEDKVVAIIGGTFGNYTSADGTLAGGIRFPAASGQTNTTYIDRPGGIGMNYKKKQLSGAETYATLRPPTYDHLTFRKPIVIPSSSVDDWKIY